MDRGWSTEKVRERKAGNTLCCKKHFSYLQLKQSARALGAHMTDRTITGSSFSDVPETCANRIALFFASGVYMEDLVQKQNCQPAEQCSSWSNSICVCILFPSSFSLI